MELSRVEHILKYFLGEEATLPQPLSRVEELLIALGRLIEEGKITNPISIKGRVNTVNDLPSNAEPGWMYFVGLADAAEFTEYIYLDSGRWEYLGSSMISIDTALSTTSTNPVQNSTITNAINTINELLAKKPGEITTGKQYVIYGQTVTAGPGAEAFNNLTDNKASGTYSHAEGNFTTASGASSHAEGGGTTASGASSHAEGNGTIASGDYSHAEGAFTKASSANQHVQGRFNTEDANNTYTFIIGNGTADNARHNAFAIDWNGLVYVNGSSTGVDLTKKPGEITTGKQYVIDGQTVTAAVGAEAFNDLANNKAVGYCSHAEGSGTTASGAMSHTEGSGTTASGVMSHTEGSGARASGASSHAEGMYTTASGDNSHSEGMYTTASGDNSHSEGSGTTASGDNSHSEGNNTKASGAQSHSEGSWTTASGDNSHAEGQGSIASSAQSHAEGASTKAYGPQSHAEGGGTTASGNCSHAEGGGTTASANNSHAEGSSTKASSANQHVQGKFNVEDANDTYAFIIGNGAADNARHNAFAIDWNGLIYVNGSATGVDVSALPTSNNFPSMTQAEYDALTPSQKTALYYFIHEDDTTEEESGS